MLREENKPDSGLLWNYLLVICVSLQPSLLSLPKLSQSLRLFTWWGDSSPAGIHRLVLGFTYLFSCVSQPTGRHVPQQGEVPRASILLWDLSMVKSLSVFDWMPLRFADRSWSFLLLSANLLSHQVLLFLICKIVDNEYYVATKNILPKHGMAWIFLMCSVSKAVSRMDPWRMQTREIKGELCFRLPGSQPAFSMD
jgi:hypothetical protein